MNLLRKKRKKNKWDLKKKKKKLKDKGADVKIGFILEFSHLKYNKTNILHSGVQT